MIQEAIQLKAEIRDNKIGYRKAMGQKDRAVVLCYANYVASKLENRWNKYNQSDDDDDLSDLTISLVK